jgi:ssRNA-specific RNase YbeY (16S rRNA maturation enzyme)
MNALQKCINKGNNETTVRFVYIDEAHSKAIVEREGRKYEINLLTVSEEKIKEIEAYHRNQRAAV